MGVRRDGDVLSTGQVGAICRVAPRTVSKWIDTGMLRGYRIPGSEDRRVTVTSLRKFLADNGMPAEWLDDYLRQQAEQRGASHAGAN